MCRNGPPASRCGRRAGRVAMLCALRRSGRRVDWRSGSGGRCCGCWSLVLLLRGLASVLEPRRPATVASAPKPAVAAWPDDEARAFAADFARAYLTYSPEDPDASASRDPRVRGAGAGELGRAGVRRGCAAARGRVGRRSRASRGSTTRTRWSRSRRRRRGRRGIWRSRSRGMRAAAWWSSDLPSLAAPPARGVRAGAVAGVAAGGERGPIEDVVSRFLRAYLGGDAGGLAYLVPAGVRIARARAAARARRRDVARVGGAGEGARARAGGDGPRAGRGERGVFYGLRYRLRLVREDRWSWPR